MPAAAIHTVETTCSTPPTATSALQSQELHRRHNELGFRSHRLKATTGNEFLTSTLVGAEVKGRVSLCCG